ncbi:MAG: RNA 2',3'-cyclic phosphodiesterase [Pseudomonadota bacterium]
MIRAFVAIAIPEPMAGTMEALQTGLDFGRLVPRENFHLTLSFLGEYPEPVLEDLHAGLNLIAEPMFDISIQGLGTFGDASPHHLFAEVTPEPALTALHKKVRRAARDAGIELAHQRFHPHVTLARFGRGLHGDDLTKLQAHIARRMGMATGSFTATGFTLFESRLTSGTPQYTPLADYDLRIG